MTIGSIQPRVTFQCNGITQAFPVPIQAYLNTDFLVLLTNVGTGVSQTLVLNSDYSLTATGTLQPPQWTLTTLAATPYVGGFDLQVIINPLQTQQSQYVQGQAFPSATLQANLDRLTLMVQRLQDQVSRSVLAPDGDIAPAMTVPSAVARALTFLGFDANGNVTATAQGAGTANTAATLGPILNPRTAAEISAGVNPLNQVYSAGPPYYILERVNATQAGLVNAMAVAVALATLSGQVGTVVIDTAIAIASAITVPSTVNLKFVSGGLLDLSATPGVVVTYNGYVEAARQQVFKLPYSGAFPTSVVNCTGSFQREFRPEWWGTTGNAVANDLPQLFACFAQAGTFVANLTASISTNQMNVTAVTGYVLIGMSVTGAGVTGNTVITGFVSGTIGGIGVYTVSVAQAVGSEAMTGTSGGDGKVNISALHAVTPAGTLFTLPIPANIEIRGVGMTLGGGFRLSGAINITWGANAFRSQLRKVSVYADLCTVSQCIIMNDAVNLNCYNNLLEDISVFGVNTISTNTTGLLTQTCQDNVVRRLRVDVAGTTAGTKGIYATAGTVALIVENPDIEAAYDSIYIDSTAQVNILNPYIERHLNTGLHFGGSSGQCTVIGGKIINPSSSQNAIQLDNPQNVNIYGTDVGATGGGVVANGGGSAYVNVNVHGVPSGRINDANNFLQVTGSGIFAGTVTVAGTTTAAVVFGTPTLNNTKYVVSGLVPNSAVAGAVLASGKGTGGFTITFPAAYTGTVDWSVRL